MGFYIPPKATTLEELLERTTVEHLLANHGHLFSILYNYTIETALQVFRHTYIPHNNFLLCILVIEMVIVYISLITIGI